MRMGASWWKAHWWKFLLILIPLQMAFNAGWDRYGMVKGVYQRLPFDAERAAFGFGVGGALSLIVLGLIVGVRFVLRKMKRPKENATRS